MMPDQTFDFTTWELDALIRKLVYRLVGPHRYMDDATQARFVLDYLDKVQEAQSLGSDIDRVYTDPQVDAPDIASREMQTDLAHLRMEMVKEAPIAEAILEDQVSSVLRSGGFGPVLSILPPVSGLFTPLPYILIVSPRQKIESIYQQQLVAGLTAAQQDEIEKEVTGEFPDYSSYTTAIGGLAAYPAMLLESSSIDWVADVMAHEWVHHYLSFHRLGWYYMKSGESRTINETTASLLGDWAGQEVINRYYAPYLHREKVLPNALYDNDEAQGAVSGFDFRAEMQRTRLNVDRLLAEGKVNEAEWYMEFQRRYFVDNGYSLRSLNQAYFAFHGAYADTRGASGSDPIGPAVRRWWMLSHTPKDFVAQLAPMTSLSELEALLAAHTG
ncbi:MAG: hypothetical protein E4H27_01130 [Anaerolineales bacterium]|nr:MAG: hypothetical protein E4H27_01130 [Anaerolineales bacterium]